MTTTIECPECGESDREHLQPERIMDRKQERIFITCKSCGTRWERHTDLCPSCGERALFPKRMPLLQKARGTQQSIVGYYMARQCNSCGWSSSGPPETSAV